MNHKITVAGVTRELPLCPIADDLYIAAFIMLGDIELTKACAKALIEIAPPHDIIVTAETKGIPLAHEMASMLGHKRYVTLRKSQKLYMSDVLSTELDSITTANRQTLFLDNVDARLIKGKQVLIVDDVVSTGNSLNAIVTLVQNAGGEVASKMTVFVEGDAQNMMDIIYLEKLPLFHLDRGTS